MITYEQMLNRDLRWAFRQGSMHFEKGNSVHASLQRIAKRLRELNTPYAVVGAMAMFFHGYRRFTEDIDILVQPEGWQVLRESLMDDVFIVDGEFSLRDAETGVRIDFFLTDRLQERVGATIAVAALANAVAEIDGISFLRLHHLMELKLLSGMRPARLRDLADAQAMLETLKLPREFADGFAPTACAKYRELWDIVQNNPEGP